LQNCTSATQDCESDDSWSPANVGTGIQFESALTAIENSLALSDADNINAQLVALPVSTNEAVLAQSTADQPTQEQIRCGIQRVSRRWRNFLSTYRPDQLAPDQNQVLLNLHYSRRRKQ